MKALITLMLATLVSLPALAADCVPQKEMAEIARSFPQYQKYASKDFCFDDGQDSHLIAGLVFMRQTAFRNPMDRSGDELFSGKFASSWWNYFIGRIEEFQIDANCAKGVVAYVYSFGGKTMYACSAALTDRFTALDLASVFMHEARHIDGYPHITCSHGPRQGLQGACDQRITDTGSYAVTVETYAQLAKYADGIHPALRAYARTAAVVYADEAFESGVRISRAERFLVMTEDRAIHSLNLDGSHSQIGLAPELGHVAMRAQHMILFPDNTSNKARFLLPRSEGEIVTSPGGLAEEYNALPSADRSSLVDVHSGAQWNARVYRTKVRFDCDPRAANTQELAINDAPIGMIYPNGYDRAVKNAQLMTESGKVFDLGCENNKAFLRSSNLTLDQKYKSLYKVGSLTLGLTFDGNLREISGSTSRAYSLGKGFDGQIHEIMPNQAIDFFNER